MADGKEDVEILHYRMDVEFPSGVKKMAVRIAQAVNFDLGMIEVSGSGLQEGRDYVVVKYRPELSVTQGERVVTVGNPLGRFEGTITRGVVSAVRDTISNDETCQFYQIDAAINPGNSGGPLFLERDNKYFWLGVNTLSVVGTNTEGLNFAIAAREAVNADYVWASADAEGAAQMIRKVYGVGAHGPGDY